MAVRPSRTNRMSDASSIATFACSNMRCGISDSSPGTIPPVSTTSKARPFQFIGPNMRSRVMPGSSVTIDRRWPIRRLNRVDLPTFGRPTMAISGRDRIRTSEFRKAKISFGNRKWYSLSFLKIAHQKMVDLSCLTFVYSNVSKNTFVSLTTETGKEPEAKFGFAETFRFFLVLKQHRRDFTGVTTYA